MCCHPLPPRWAWVRPQGGSDGWVPHSISGWGKGKPQHHSISSGDLQVSSVPFRVGADPCPHVEVEEVQGVWLAGEGAACGPGQRRATDLLPPAQSLCRPALMSEAGNSTLFSVKVTPQESEFT